MRAWPRTVENDPFCAGSMDLAESLSQKLSYELILGFNEFCDPTMDEAFDQAVELGAEKVLVITPMMTPGGEHSEKDIPSAIARARQRHPEVEFRYAWPFDVGKTADFLASQIKRFE